MTVSRIAPVLESLIDEAPTLHTVISTNDNNYHLVRLFLSASVVYYHAFGMTNTHSYYQIISPPSVASFASIGTAAVALFFFLSGLFVTNSYRKEQSFIKFGIKRFLRIMPGFIVCMMVTALLASAISHPNDYWKFFLFPGFYEYITQNILMDIRYTIRGVFDGLPLEGTINGSIHTIPLEVRMYAILAVLGIASFLRRRWTIVASGAVILASYYFAPDVFQRVIIVDGYHTLPIAMFFFGVIACGLATRIRVSAVQFIIAVPIAALSVIYSNVFLFYAFAVWLVLLFGQNYFVRRTIPLKEDISYGLYIYGWPITQAVAAFFPDIHPYLLFATSLLLTSIIAWVSWRLVEKPMLALYSVARHKRSGLASRPTAGTILTNPLFVATWVSTAVIACFVMRETSQHFVVGPATLMDTTITNFGPQTTEAGTGFNVDPSTGSSTLWVVFSGPEPKDAKLQFGSEFLTPSVQPGVVTTFVPSSGYDDPGTKTIRFENRFYDRVEYSNSVDFIVTAP
jgi:peptidoglycan/LPS O-acetylase OafA/YrhL